MTVWTRREPEILRPFFGAQAAEDLLKHAAIVLRPGDEPNKETRIVELGGLHDVEPSLLPNLDLGGLDNVFGDKRDAFELVVTLRTQQMFRRELVAHLPIDDDLPETIAIPAPMLRDAKLSGLFELGLSICLAEDGELGPGWPSHVGAWVARKNFTVGLDRRQSAFQIEPLSETVIKDLKLPKGTFVHVEEVSDLNQIYDDGETCARAYVAESLYAKQSGAKANSAITALVFSEIVAAVLMHSENGISEASAVVPDTPLDAILANLNGERKLELHELKRLIEEPVKLRAAIHDARALVEELEKL